MPITLPIDIGREPARRNAWSLLLPRSRSPRFPKRPNKSRKLVPRRLLRPRQCGCAHPPLQLLAVNDTPRARQ